MKKTLFVVIVTALFAAGATTGTASLIRPHGATQSITFDDNGQGGGDGTHGGYLAGEYI